MSKIVRLNTSFGVSTVDEALLAKIAIHDPAKAEWLRGLKPTELYEIARECLFDAVDQLIVDENSDITAGTKVTDYNNHQSTESFDFIVKTPNLPHGLGIKIDQQCKVTFVADDYGSWAKEIKRIEGRLHDAHVAQIIKAYMTIAEFNITLSESDPVDGTQRVNGERLCQ